MNILLKALVWIAKVTGFILIYFLLKFTIFGW